MKTRLLIDANSVMNRAFYGIRPLTTKDGLFTQAVYGTINMVNRQLAALSPDYAAAAFDLPAPTFRHKLSGDYKANRKKMPEELAVQLPYVKKTLAAMGFAVCECAGYEADDIIGTLSRPEEDVFTYILTGDRDSLQLIDDHTSVLLAGTGETPTFDREAFVAKYGVPPENFIEVKALMGDSSDNIPGVPGIGEKTALALVARFGTLEAIYAALPDAALTKSVNARLEAGRESAFLSRTLATICRDVPLGYGSEGIQYNGFRRDELSEILDRLELFTVKERLLADSEETSVNSACLTVKAEDTDIAQFRAALPTAAAASITADGFTVSDGSRSLRVTAAAEPGMFSGVPGRLCVQDTKRWYHAFGDTDPGCGFFDASLAAYLINPTDGFSADIKRLAAQYSPKAFSDDSDEAAILAVLREPLESRLDADGLREIYEKIELPLAAVLAGMERRGFTIDTEGLAEFSRQLSERVAEYAENIYFLAGETFNINSPKQLGDLLYDKLMLPPPKKSGSGRSTDADTLAKLRPLHPIIDAILDYRQVSKLKSTYTDGLIKVADGNRRIHTSFNQTVTATGRLSSTEPNLQNIPVRQPLGRELRRFFIAQSDDYVLIDADYSQIELRLLAAISGDEAMTAAFRDGIDIHTFTASQVFGVPVEAVTGEQRKRAKAVNFGIVYGIGEYSLSQDIGTSVAAAGRYIQSYFDKYPSVRSYLDGAVAAARQCGYAATLFGRRRYIPELNVQNRNLRAFGERVAMNSPIQGTAADIIKLAMINTDREFAAAGIDARLILQVHDELIVEAKRDCAAEAERILKREMEGAVSLSVPLTVEIASGSTWYDCKS